MKRIGALVSGRVQGVGFRYFAKTAADRLALDGWVRNTPDGNVELEAQGTDENIAAFLAELKTGPRTGHVADIRVCEMPPVKQVAGFEIR